MKKKEFEKLVTILLLEFEKNTSTDIEDYSEYRAGYVDGFLFVINKISDITKKDLLIKYKN